MNYIAHLFYNYFLFLLIINLLDIQQVLITKSETLPFSESFSNPQKTFKKIKKAGNSKNYEIAVKEIFKNG